MFRLTNDEKSFLAVRGLTERDVFDAKGLSRSQYETEMRDRNLLVAINVTPCRKHGHRIRTRAGHCVQCFPASLRYLKRYNSEGYVYLAHSMRRGLIKVGMTRDIAVRQASLLKTKYGGVSDWKIFDSKFFDEDAGVAENVLHMALRKFAVPGMEYMNGDVLREGREVFSCEKKYASSLLNRLEV